ncbi:MAG: recombination protein RecR [Anaerolineales bacterium]|nr:recombination protein RecR [Anaerolineales bacterium]
MAGIPQPVERLIEAFSRLPGIGPKTASRLTFYMLRSSAEEAEELAEALKSLHEGTVFCSRCFHITSRNLDPCGICRDEQRDSSKICVVEEPLDVLALERTAQYEGLYHVLHGAISPIEGIGPENLRIAELMERVAREHIGELILATNPTLEGEATAMYLKQQFGDSSLRITRLARGLPSGGDLEYADLTTLAQALTGRSEL